MEETLANLTSYLNLLHVRFQEEAGTSASGDRIWNAFYEVTRDTILQWDAAHAGKFPEIRQDNSIFVSMASYRDELCLQTMQTLFGKAAHPERLFVGLIQQNCDTDCKTGVLEGGRVEDASPDSDCFAGTLF
jgi:hypothetical protein